MKNRLKELRKNHLHLTQAEFGKKIGLTDVAISRYEKGERNITQQVFISICREFNVNEEWLRTGKGEMFKEEEFYSLDELLKQRNATPLEVEFMKIYFSLDEDTRKKIIADFKKAIIAEDPYLTDNRPAQEQSKTIENDCLTQESSENAKDITESNEDTGLTSSNPQNTDELSATKGDSFEESADDLIEKIDFSNSSSKDILKVIEKGDAELKKRESQVSQEHNENTA